ncbi:hypothetical protein EMIHUDRAFT_198397 [Emiliania huxleyi CCMP1516]|uniref:Uncharacterized protein n=2 Tax=Emiliania huxleyi TaxID=2903 RepID=A0A0D3I770_EMIH1|nr:hypothetical protein EMIHUDRAFT_198397 [Emiliania huxleyi CCMP1516]EOD07105.1 hypothetical protein EMIHUDRAFT_198397 [Emiliania huxleyi CCMP1516]|eukprot:XP_005759534.1 hypothetical protein EMIHUDRAFT_198397 [Emiliania huxleyi CCMP1516]
MKVALLLACTALASGLQSAIPTQPLPLATRRLVAVPRGVDVALPSRHARASAGRSSPCCMALAAADDAGQQLDLGALGRYFFAVLMQLIALTSLDDSAPEERVTATAAEDEALEAALRPDGGGGKPMKKTALRAECEASCLVYSSSTGRLNEGHFNDPAAEGRVGAAVPGSALVCLSALYAAKQYSDVAGMRSQTRLTIEAFEGL